MILTDNDRKLLLDALNADPSPMSLIFDGDPLWRAVERIVADKVRDAVRDALAPIEALANHYDRPVSPSQPHRFNVARRIRDALAEARGTSTDQEPT